MRPTAKLAAATVWIAVVVSIAVTFLFWQIGYLRPHGYWAALCLLTVLLPLLGLCWHVLRGPARLKALGWLLIGATPIVWIGSYFGYLIILATSRAPLVVDAPMSIAAVGATTGFDLLARWQYPRWTHGQHAVLMDDGKTPDAQRLVDEMDQHLQNMAQLLGKPVPDFKFPWVRGSLFGLNGRAVVLWALCGDDDSPAELTHLDNHEMAHTLITALAGHDHLPPFVLIEGWAESQSSDRDDQIYILARYYKDGTAYTLQELVNSYWYGKASAPVYWQGGPLVHYLMEHYGPEKFLEFYSGVRRNSFHKDCQRILGDSWETVEKQFWPWIESEAQQIVQAGTLEVAIKWSPPTIEFAPEVNPEDWQAFLAGYQSANSSINRIPQNVAFLVEHDRTVTDENTNLENELFSTECRAVFAEKNFWIYENYSHGADRYLMIKDDLCADLARDEEGNLNGSIKGAQEFKNTQFEVENLLHNFFGTIAPTWLLPFPNSTRSGHFQITSITRPEQGSTDPWAISYTLRSQEGKIVSNVHLDIDPAQDWSIVRLSREKPGNRTFVTEIHYQRINESVVPKSTVTRNVSDTSEIIGKASCRQLTEQEQNQLRQRVEQAVATGPKPPHQNWLRFLTAIAILCPLLGILCLLPLLRHPQPHCHAMQGAPSKTDENKNEPPSSA